MHRDLEPLSQLARGRIVHDKHSLGGQLRIDVQAPVESRGIGTPPMDQVALEDIPVLFVPPHLLLDHLLDSVGIVESRPPIACLHSES